MTNPAEAAERLRRHNWIHEPPWVVEAICVLVAEHQADDGEAITEEWWNSVATFSHWGKPAIRLKDSSLTWENRKLYLSYRSDDYLLCDGDTRGDLRRLATALGIELKGH